MGILKDAATIVLPLLGVLVGARLARGAAETNWLRQERLKMYVDLIAKFEAVNSIFRGKVQIARFKGGPVTLGAPAHLSYKTVVDEFYASVSAVMDVSNNLRILSKQYENEIHDDLSDLWIRMIELVNYGNTTTTAEEWKDCSTANGKMILKLIDESRRELDIPVRKARWQK